jgi:hypothetical protein
MKGCMGILVKDYSKGSIAEMFDGLKNCSEDR